MLQLRSSKSLGALTSTHTDTKWKHAFTFGLIRCLTRSGLRMSAGRTKKWRNCWLPRKWLPLPCKSATGSQGPESKSLGTHTLILPPLPNVRWRGERTPCTIALKVLHEEPECPG